MKKMILLMFIITVMSFANQTGYEGYWMMPDGKFIIKIDKQSSGEYIGKVAWLKMKYYGKGDKEEGVEQHDRNNNCCSGRYWCWRGWFCGVSAY